MELCWVHHRLVHEGGFGVEPEGKGQFTFHRPDGTAIPRSPTLPERPPDGIKDLNRQAGLHIDHHTGDCRWTGEQIDYHDAVFLLFQADGRL